MTLLSLIEPSGRYLSFVEREEIGLLRAQNMGVREIARQLGRDPGTISRELRRNFRYPERKTRVSIPGRAMEITAGSEAPQNRGTRSK